ncbi:MAG TPA: 16S rRNA (cytosine(967)-C(5))-methyltransferase RsmB [Clostridiales bacterium]|nr:16S rRNA (cytosine(967)-C(5))-methyltransferase RsmB [Clostridiales bacterium]
MDSTRLVAYEIIYEVLENNAYINIALNKGLKSRNPDVSDRRLISMLVYGTVSYKLTLDHIIEKFSERSINAINKRIRNVLRLGVFQLVYSKFIPAYSACNESVQLAKKLSNKNVAGFVNAVLRNISRSGHPLELPDKNSHPVEYLSLKYSISEEIVRKIISVFGMEQAELFCSASLERPDLFISVNTNVTNVESLLVSLTKQGFEAEIIDSKEPVLKLKSGSGLFDTSEFEQGAFFVMDEGAVLPINALEPKPGSFILDCCAAPGGKTMVISQRMNGTGRILAMDVHPHKIDLMEKNFQRAGRNNIECVVQDARVLREDLVESADGVLLDVPCSGLGIIRRKPDIKWNYKSDPELIRLQKEILDNCCNYVKKGGTLVYSTCTVLPEENEDRIKTFLKEHQEFELAPYQFEPGMITPYENGTFVNTYPHIHGTDGFFTAKMVKR